MSGSVLPETPAEPVTETVGGITFEDPYTWLEADTERTLAWQAAQNAAALTRIRAWPGYDLVRDQVAQFVGDDFITAPQHYGDKWFEMRFDEAGPQLVVTPQPGGPEVVLVDTAASGDAAGPASLDWLYPSPDGRLVAYGLSFNGDEQSVLHIVEVDSGRGHQAGHR
jgi:prolyl oligopeptidase